jgi:phosphate transport system protein
MRTVEQLPDACLSAGAQMLRATKALVLADEGEAQDVIRVHDDVTARTVQAEASALQLLVSGEGDLPGLAVSLQTVTDVNQMNILARRVARVALRADPMHALPEDVNGYFSEMGNRADQLGRRLRELLEGTTQLYRILHEEDEMDRQHRRLSTFMTGPEWRHSVNVALDVTRLDTYYERFTDHAVAIAHRVQLLNEGTRPNPDEH